MIKVGSRVEVLPHPDEWVQDDRFGVVTHAETFHPTGILLAKVRLDKSSRILVVRVNDLREV